MKRRAAITLALAAMLFLAACAQFSEQFARVSTKYLCKLSPDARAELIVKINDELVGSGITYTEPTCPKG